MNDTSHMSPDEAGIYGITVPLMHMFTKERKYASKSKGWKLALRKFRRREWIEDFFEEYKQRVESSRYRVWDDLTLEGKKRSSLSHFAI